MNEREFLKRYQRGFGLTELMLTGALLAVILFAILSSTEHLFRSSSKLNSSLDLSGIRLGIQQAVNCAATFPSPSSPPCTAGSYVTLRAANGRTVVDSAGTQIGKHVVLAQCTGTGVDIRAAALTPANMTNPAARSFSASDPSFFRTDEVDRDLRYNWSHPKARLFDGPGFCSHLFGGAGGASTNCGPSQYVVGVNFATNSVVCGNIPTCPMGASLSWDGASFLCVASAGWPAGSYCIIQAQSQGCPAGFSAVDPSNSDVAGNGLGGESFLVRGDSYSTIYTRNTAWSMNTSFNGPVKVWAWCCK